MGDREVRGDAATGREWAAEAPPERRQEVVEAVRRHYAGVAQSARAPAGGCGTLTQGSCGQAGCTCGPQAYYAQEETTLVPDAALRAGAGCGNPVALARLQPGEVVLDLGSGGGLDVLLSARRVGPGGFVYGVDMTDEMLALAEENRRKSGLANVAFLKGRIEEVPLPDEAVDVVISNCVINLSVDKAAVLREAARVLRPGGRLAVYDVVSLAPLPDSVRRDLEAWAACAAGALDVITYRHLLEEAGFVDVSVEPVEEPGTSCCGDAPGAGEVRSAFIRARKIAAPEGRPVAPPAEPIPDAGEADLPGVEPATPVDREGIVALLREAGLPVAGIGDPGARLFVARHGGLAGRPEAMRGTTLAEGGIAGCAGIEVHGAQALLRSVVVRPGWRGRRLGRALVERCLEEAARSGASEAYLLTTEAAGYFARFGFTQVARDEVTGPVTLSGEFTGLCPRSAIVMVRRLDDLRPEGRPRPRG